MIVVLAFETWGYNYPVTQRHFQEEPNSQLEHCENFRTHIKLTHYYHNRRHHHHHHLLYAGYLYLYSCDKLCP